MIIFSTYLLFLLQKKKKKNEEWKSESILHAKIFS